MNDALVPVEEVGAVERKVNDLFTDSAISIQWIHGGDEGRSTEERWACGHPEPLRVIILRWMKDAKNALPAELGESFMDANGIGVVADVFMNRVLQLKREREVSFTALLAHVTAHEIGHLLLGPHSHSASGLMRAKLNEETLSRMMQGDFGFTRQQEKAMHARVKGADRVRTLAQNRPI